MAIHIGHAVVGQDRDLPLGGPSESVHDALVFLRSYAAGHCAGDEEGMVIPRHIGASVSAIVFQRSLRISSSPGREVSKLLQARENAAIKVTAGVGEGGRLGDPMRGALPVHFGNLPANLLLGKAEEIGMGHRVVADFEARLLEFQDPRPGQSFLSSQPSGSDEEGGPEAMPFQNGCHRCQVREVSVVEGKHHKFLWNGEELLVGSSSELRGAAHRAERGAHEESGILHVEIWKRGRVCEHLRPDRDNFYGRPVTAVLMCDGNWIAAGRGVG